MQDFLQIHPVFQNRPRCCCCKFTIALPHHERKINVNGQYEIICDSCLQDSKNEASERAQERMRQLRELKETP